MTGECPRGPPASRVSSHLGNDRTRYTTVSRRSHVFATRLTRQLTMIGSRNPNAVSYLRLDAGSRFRFDFTFALTYGIRHCDPISLSIYAVPYTNSGTILRLESAQPLLVQKPINGNRSFTGAFSAQALRTNCCSWCPPAHDTTRTNASREKLVCNTPHSQPL